MLGVERHRKVGMTAPQLRRGECRIHLTPLETQLLAVLLVSPPEWSVPLPMLVEEMWPDADLQPEDARNIVSVEICRLRRLGIRIENRHGFGWRIPAAARLEEEIHA